MFLRELQRVCSLAAGCIVGGAADAKAENDIEQESKRG